VEIRVEVLGKDGTLLGKTSSWARRVLGRTPGVFPSGSEALSFWDASVVIEDTRVPPGGSREFHMELKYPDGADSVCVSLIYHRWDPSLTAGHELPDPLTRILYEESFPMTELLELGG
jgi:hypothetical protein